MPQAEKLDDLLDQVKIPKPDEIRRRIAENIRQRQLLRQLLKLAEQRQAVEEVSSVQVVSADLLARVKVVVDPDADPFDLDRFLDALDRLVERRLQAKRKLTTSGGTPAAAVDLTTGDKGRQ